MSDKQTIPFLTPKLPAVGTSIFAVMSGLAHEYGAINLSQGFPDFKVDQRLLDYVSQGMNLGHLQYAPMPGRQDLREEIAKKAAEQHDIQLNPDTEITITAGATQAIYCIISGVVNTGDEVILFDPAYDCYDPAVKLNKGIPIHLKLQHPDYKIDWLDLKNHLNEKSRMLILNNPHNPCGSVWDASDLEELEKILMEFPKLLVLSDEVYEHIQFEGDHQTVLASEILREQSFVTYSFGKTFHVTGWKIGYCIAPKELTNEFRMVHQFNVFCVNNTIQYAIANYLKEKDEWKKVMSLYKTKRDLFLNAMKDSRFVALKCTGTYFCLFDYTSISDESDLEFSKRITKESGVACIPVSVFYQDKTDHQAEADWPCVFYPIPIRPDVDASAHRSESSNQQS